MGRLIGFTPGLYALTVFLQIARLSMVLLPGLIVREVFNVLTGESRYAALFCTGFWLLVALLVVVAIVRVTTVLTAIFVEYTTSFYSAALLRKNLFAHLMDTPSAGALAYTPGDMVSRLEADTRLIAEYLRELTLVIGTAGGAVLAMIIMARIDALITTAALVPLILVGVVVNMAGGKLGRLRRAKRTADSRINTFLAEMFSAVQAIKVHTAEERVITQLQTLNDSRREAALREVMFRDWILSGFDTMTLISTGVILLLAGQAMRAGTFTVGDFALFVAYLEPVADFTVRFGQNVAAYQQVNVSWERLHQLLRGAPLETLVKRGPVYMDGSLPEVPYLLKTEEDRLIRLEVQGLSYRYPSTGRGIEDISFTLARGSFTVITGRIGSGKTTLLRVLLGVLPRPEATRAGEIRWNGQLVADPANCFVPPHCAYTPQVPRLFSETLRDNILLGLPAAQANLEWAIRMAVLTQDIASFEAGLETVVGPRGIKLSGGQIQRTAAARMFIRTPELLVVDDVSSALDIETEQTLWQQVFDLPDVTCLVVSHRRPILRRADQIIVLQAGRVVGHGTFKELLETCKEFKQIWQGNLGKREHGEIETYALM